MCYQCNSFTQPYCNDPFHCTLTSHNSIVNCSEAIPSFLINETSIVPFCRKIRQVVDDRVTVIRSCGFIEGRETDGNCLRRSGSPTVRALSCGCTSDFCNTANSTNLNLFLITLMIFSLGETIFYIRW